MSSSAGESAEVVVMAIDAEACIAGGQCEMLAPEVFEVDEDTAVAVFLGDGHLDRTAAELVIDRCPSGAISIEPQ